MQDPEVGEGSPQERGHSRRFGPSNIAAMIIVMIAFITLITLTIYVMMAVMIVMIT